MRKCRVITWNLFHGRSPDVNRVLFDEFADRLAAEPWDVALLQEAPPHWLRPLARRAGASGASVLTSRNFGAFIRRRVAEWNPGLIKSGEGGSNQILVRGERLQDVRRLTLTLLPERRRMIWVRLEGLCVATLHATAHDPNAAARDVLKAVRAASAWSAGTPLIFGGDLNLRPDEVPSELGLDGVLRERAIDHLLTRGLDVVEEPHSVSREVGGIRLSDHAPVAATYGIS